MRMLIIKEDSDQEAVARLLLTARLSASDASGALERVQALNPHVDLKKLKAGTVLLIPSAPGFKVSASTSIPGQALDGLMQTVKDSLSTATERMRKGNAEREAERGEVQAVLKLAAVKRLIDADPELRQLVADATKTAKEDEQQAAEAEKSLATVGKAALNKLAELEKLLG